MFIVSVFRNVFDWTAVGTLTLAAVTLISLYFARDALAKTQVQIELGQLQLAQTQREIELSRREVEEAHRPVIVPVVNTTSFMDLGADGHGLTRTPQLPHAGFLFIPVENIGAGPALNIEASVAGVGLPPEAETEPQTAARADGVRAGGFVPLRIELPRWKELLTFVLTIDYSDVAGNGWRTQGTFFRDMGRYADVTITELER